MLVRHRMTQHPVTVSPQDSLATAQEKMTAGHFRRLPVVHDGTLVGILTDRDVRRHVGVEARTRARAAMTETPLTISPATTVEEAVQLMLKHQISGLPVVENGKVVGIITTSDILRAFLEMTGASTPESVRIDLLQTEKGGDLAKATALVNEMGGEVLGVGTYRDPWSEQPIFYLRLVGIDAAAASVALQNEGYTVLSTH
ncbi:MAG TPA: CBS domain-containing protein [Candidatus Binatia bacterium]|nr:CBS domain-containing protein [Candidatus Binatia bacterium]